MVYVLIFLACLGERCVPIPDPYSNLFATQQQCLLTGQAIAAEWLGDHPDYTLGRLSCLPPVAMPMPRAASPEK